MSLAKTAAVAIDGGDLPLGGGLLALIRPALQLLEPGGVLAILSRSPQLQDDLAAWCRIEHHKYLGPESSRAESSSGESSRHLIERGDLGIPYANCEDNESPKGRSLNVAESLARCPMPAEADPGTGFAPRGAFVEPGGPVYPVSLLTRDLVAAPDIGGLYDQSVGAVWDANTDIPWDKVKRLPPELEAAVGQVMTFLAENELSALYVPSKFISRIHPDYAEVAMFLATQLSDEARHIDVFLRRARIFGRLGVSSATTSRSLLSLLELEDFTEAAFLLSVLGEGTFLDLLRFIERYAPDEATAELTRRARNDETRHVHFGLSHVRNALTHNPGLYGQLENAVRRRSASLASAGGVPAPIQDALTVLAAGGTEPHRIGEGHDRFRELLADMHENRIKRLRNAGFTAEQAATLSDLHTPNFM
ncbi:MAG TPA: ferritin-like domain-containing protein [Blastocatellia bacterium]|nr:ferritin-like domain-containing protein [Blastocatellia bacterium]